MVLFQDELAVAFRVSHDHIRVFGAEANSVVEDAGWDGERIASL